VASSAETQNSAIKDAARRLRTWLVTTGSFVHSLVGTRKIIA
jgi:hypothetical protein